METAAPSTGGVGMRGASSAVRRGSGRNRPGRESGRRGSGSRAGNADDYRLLRVRDRDGAADPVAWGLCYSCRKTRGPVFAPADVEREARDRAMSVVPRFRRSARIARIAGVAWIAAMARSAWTARIAVAAVSGALAVPPVVAQEPGARIGTVLDGGDAADLEFRAAVQEEAERLLGTRFAVSFPEEKQLVGDRSAAAARRNLDALLADPEIDAVLALGLASSAYAGRLPVLAKPVVAALVVFPEIQGIPVAVRERPITGRSGVERVRVSGVPNLSYVTHSQDLVREAEAFREIAPFSELALLLLETIEDEFPAAREIVARELEPVGVGVAVVPVGASVEQALARLPDEVEAVMLTGMPQLSEPEFRDLVGALHERGLPTWSLEGQGDVRRGVLAGLNVERNALFLVRRIALNLFDILRGEEAAEIPVDFVTDEQITINLASARAVGISPTFRLLTEAELVDDTGPRTVRRVSLAEVVREAESVNLDLAAAERMVAAGLEQVREARSSLLPQASVSGQGVFIDEDRASVFQGARQVLGGVGVRQTLYSERARSGYDIERQSQVMREEERFRTRLDIVADAARQYLEVLRAKTVENIQKTNLALTRSNLALAEARVEIGAAGRGEALRWRSQLAQNRRSVLAAAARRSQAEIAVNRLLDRPLEEPFDTVEAGLDDPELTVNFEVLGPFIERPSAFERLREFMTGEALSASPELRRLDAAILVQERLLLANRRAFFLPTVNLDAQLQTVRNDGDSQPAPAAGPDGVNWTVAVEASLPIFRGGALRAQRSRAEIELEQFTIDREAVSAIIEQRIRSALYGAQASFAGIELAREAAEAARENLDLVRDAYLTGVEGIVRLLDAQTQALSAELEASDAVFGHLGDLMEVQRAAGRFDYFRPPGERAEWIRRLEAFMEENGHGDHDD